MKHEIVHERRDCLALRAFWRHHPRSGSRNWAEPPAAFSVQCECGAAGHVYNDRAHSGFRGGLQVRVFLRKEDPCPLIWDRVRAEIPVLSVLPDDFEGMHQGQIDVLAEEGARILDAEGA